MKEKTGTVFSIASDNAPVPGCTISREIYKNGDHSITYFSMAKGTDISAETHPYGMLLIIAGGDLEVYGSEAVRGPAAGTAMAESGGAGVPVRSGSSGNREKSGYEYTEKLTAGESLLIAPGALAGMRTEHGAVYTEISLRRDDAMNEAVKAGEVFKLADLVPYQDGRIVNMDVMHNDKMKFVVMAFDGGTGLSEHAAPGEAIIFALDGEGIIGYDGVEHPIKAGENFHFAKGGMHFVKAPGRFKMGLLLTLD